MSLKELVNRIFPGLPAIVELYAGKPFRTLYESGELRSVLAKLYGEYAADVILDVIRRHVEVFSNKQ